VAGSWKHSGLLLKFYLSRFQAASLLKS